MGRVRGLEPQAIRRNHSTTASLQRKAQPRTPSARPGTTRKPEGSPGPGLLAMCSPALVMVRLFALCSAL